MPIISQDVVDGPNIEADDSRRGVVEFTFADGRVVRKSIRAPDATAWANLLVDLPSEVEAQVQAQDAEAAAQSGLAVVDAEAGEASREQLALAYLRDAYARENPYEAFLQLDRFNTWRLSRGINLNQVVSALSAVGLTQEEWDLLLASYQYLSNAARVTAMEAYQPIIANWVDREPI